MPKIVDSRWECNFKRKEVLAEWGFLFQTRLIFIAFISIPQYIEHIWVFPVHLSTQIHILKTVEANSNRYS